MILYNEIADILHFNDNSILHENRNFFLAENYSIHATSIHHFL